MSVLDDLLRDYQDLTTGHDEEFALARSELASLRWASERAAQLEAEVLHCQKLVSDLERENESLTGYQDAYEYLSKGLTQDLREDRDALWPLVIKWRLDGAADLAPGVKRQDRDDSQEAGHV